MPTAIRAIATRRELGEFIRFPLRLYRGDPLYVPHLTWERKGFFNPKKNPLFEFTDVAYFLARDEPGNVVGRVTAHVNRRHNEFWDERTGFFGFFECVEDHEVAASLMEAAEGWLRGRGMERARGPFNFSTNEECGFLAEGFDRPPAIMMPYTRPYYLEFMDRLGYRPVQDLLAFECEYGEVMPEYVARLSRRVRERTGVVVRSLDMRDFEHEVAIAFGVYNSAWQRNWGFIPMTQAEFRYAARTLKPIIDPAIALIAEKDGQPVGFGLGLPDYNVVLKKMRGRLLPFGFLHALLGRRRIGWARLIILGVIDEYRRRGVDMLLYHGMFYNGLPKGYHGCEMGWVLADNEMMVRPIERMGGVASKRYRIFEKDL